MLLYSTIDGVWYTTLVGGVALFFSFFSTGSTGAAYLLVLLPFCVSYEISIDILYYRAW